MLLDPTEVSPNVTTRDGAPVMLFAYFSHQQRVYAGAYFYNDAWISLTWNKDGTYISKLCPSGADLLIVPVPPTQSKRIIVT